MDIQAFEDVVRKYSPAVYNHCLYRLSFNHQLAEEALNDTMRVLYTKWDTLVVDDSILRYLYRVSDNFVKQARERDSKYYAHNTSFEGAIDEGTVAEPLYCDDYFHDIDAEDKFMRDIVESFSEEYKVIFKYRYIDKKTIMEIVELTGIAYSSLRLRLMKIEEYIKEQVKNNY